MLFMGKLLHSKAKCQGLYLCYLIKYLSQFKEVGAIKTL